MKKSTIIIFLVLAMLKIQAQDYLISFTGAGATTEVGAVKVDNLTSGATLTLNGGDILHLFGSVGMDALNLDNENIRLYANPMAEQSILAFVAPENGNADISIVDLSGKTVCQISKLLSPGTVSFRVSGINQGMYFVKVTGKNYFYSTKLISQSNLRGDAEIEYVSSEKNIPGAELKSAAATIDMPYADGDQLVFKGISGIYSTIFADVPVNNKTITFNFTACTDAHNNNYSIVQIGAQTWMAENLNVGVRIYGCEEQINNGTIEKYCYNNDEANCAIYGGLYQWNEMMQYITTLGVKGICPTGWHIPTDGEWTTLTTYLGESVAGGKMKSTGIIEAGTGLWYSPNTGATNESGFTAVPAGVRSNGGAFCGIGSSGFLGSSSEYEYATSDAWGRCLYYSWGDVGSCYGSKSNGLSVRCLWDQSGGTIPTVITNPILNITKTTATGGGNITAQGSSSVTARGLCWSTFQNPTTTDVHTTDGTGTGSFTSNITGLTANTLYYVRAYATNSVGTSYGSQVSFTTIGGSGGQPCPGMPTITINHVAGNVAPVNKTVTYGTVTNIPGETSKCWITSNLGSDHQASAVNDVTEASAGWYWQFNRKQGYKHDGSTVTPSWTIISISENFDWLPANDPCALELGTGWRVPTYNEWNNVFTSGGWTNWNGLWNSGLKLHAAGLLFASDGWPLYRGSSGYYQSSTQYDSGTGWNLGFQSGGSGMSISYKAYGFPLRCLRDSIITPTTTTVTGTLTGALCYDATQTITVAGNGTTFTVQSGGNATLIAGQNIKYLPTTIVQSGGFMWGYIAPGGPYCLSPSIPAIVAGEVEMPLSLSQSFFKIYPNPTTGTLILELTGDISVEKVTVDIYGIWGEKVLTETLNRESKHEFTLSDKPSGIYFIRVISGDKAETVKIIKQ